MYVLVSILLWQYEDDVISTSGDCSWSASYVFICTFANALPESRYVKQCSDVNVASWFNPTLTELSPSWVQPDLNIYLNNFLRVVSRTLKPSSMRSCLLSRPGLYPCLKRHQLLCMRNLLVLLSLAYTYLAKCQWRDTFDKINVPVGFSEQQGKPRSVLLTKRVFHRSLSPNDYK